MRPTEQPNTNLFLKWDKNTNCRNKRKRQNPTGLNKCFNLKINSCKIKLTRCPKCSKVYKLIFKRKTKKSWNFLKANRKMDLELFLTDSTNYCNTQSSSILIKVSLRHLLRCKNPWAEFKDPRFLKLPNLTRMPKSAATKNKPERFLIHVHLALHNHNKRLNHWTLCLSVRVSQLIACLVHVNKLKSNSFLRIQEQWR